MSLASKWEELRDHLNRNLALFGDNLTPAREQLLKETFYAGAEAAITKRPCDECEHFQAEIDHFRSHAANVPRNTN